METLYSVLYKALLFCAVVTFFIGLMSTGTGRVFLGASMAGYITCILAVMMILLITYSGLLPHLVNQSGLRQVGSILLSSGPFLLMLASLGMMLYLTIKNKENIRRNRVDPAYFTYNNITLLLLILQTYLVYQSIFSADFETSGKISTFAISLLYLTAILTLLSASIVYITLQIYRTDGFQVLSGLPMAVF